MVYFSALSPIGCILLGDSVDSVSAAVVDRNGAGETFLQLGRAAVMDGSEAAGRYGLESGANLI